ncbi:MbcA/ParS/Xre antitoxin family protein [Galbibacter mesophilus]|uniref:MbcA/ParS/Xre antitoxin family protein n=1 Tax=Galbibacter mesophilus TaxID=379069 RepID=UPI00191DC0E9|nr:MbcA/ParS/Xre antitoxin family protein [Galbibacter mesophilus]MCM5664364.1 MbcA/ParS/Xre antitoxin family protein [Galbibacter mesophilus]
MKQELNDFYEYGYKVFGDKTKFHLWLETKSPALGDKTPASYFIRTNGFHILRQTLQRLENNGDD